MMSDTVDYGEWCNGKRLAGISFAGTLFVLKLGLALGGALIGWMLAGGENAKQRYDRHHHRSVHYRSGHLLSAERRDRQTLLHPEKPVPENHSGTTGAGRTPQRTRIYP